MLPALNISGILLIFQIFVYTFRHLAKLSFEFGFVMGNICILNQRFAFIANVLASVQTPIVAIELNAM